MAFPSRFFLSIVFLLLNILFVSAQDTIVVETFDFSDPSPVGFSAPYRGTFQFPDTSESFEKVLMYYTLKCDPATNQDGFDCGEWDYLTYTYVYDSTAWFDSTYRTHPNFQIGGQTPDSLALALDAQYSYTQDWQYFPVVSDTNQVAVLSLGNGTQSSSQPMNGQSPRSRTQFLWRATELSSAGLSAGTIRGLQLDLTVLPGELKYFQIRIRHSTLDSLTASQVETDSFQTVYRRHTSFPTGMTGWQSFLFHQAFVWDGSRNLVVEFTYDNDQSVSNAVLSAETTPFSSGAYTQGNEHYLSFQGPDEVKLDASVFANGLSDQVTISLWQYGDPNLQPQSDHVFEARDSSNRRVLNVHLPWGNSQVFWDAGNSGTGSYDRISQTANFSDFAGQWNHWAFTKDANTGEMRIYLNGQLWHSGTGFTRTMDGIASFTIGANGAGGNNYDGFLDEFQVWDTVLDQSTIQAWMNRSANANHPQYNHLLAYFSFNEGLGTLTTDQSPNQIQGTLSGYPDWRKPRPQDLFRDWVPTSLRPNIRFDQSDYIYVLDSVLVRDSVVILPSSIVLFGNDPQGTLIFDGSANHPTQATDTLSAWEVGGYRYIYDWATGAIVDSILIQPDLTLVRDDIEYYSNLVRYELGRYITPYGINLDLGPNGKTWVFDVTDYAPLLHDAVRLQAGNNQELLDLRFVMIKGTPPRTVLAIENLWNGSFSYASLVEDNNGAAVQKILHPQARMFQIKTRTTGHGFNNATNCSEFCPRYHYLLLNQQQAFSWYLWNECSDNFVYPQGGTWIYDRAGWCPGAKVNTYEHELTPLVSPGDTVSIDYDVQDSGGQQNFGNYVLEGQLFSYTAPNFDRNAAITEIVSPSNKDEWSRHNPICDHPTIQVRNLGADTIHSLKLEYGTIDGIFPCYYYWEGSLGFLESQEIDLPRFNWTGTNQSQPRFFAEIVEVNGVAGDEQATNNRLETDFELVPNYLPGLVLQIKTNLAGSENSYRIYDQDGNIVKLRFGLASNTLYNDTLNLGQGCFTLHFLDSGQDGISWWANNDGTGAVRLLNPNGGFYQVFEPDYGKDIVHQFTIGYLQGSEAPDVSCDPNVSLDPAEPGLERLEVYPNPSQGRFSVDMAFASQQDVRLQILNSLGGLVHEERYRAILSQIVALELSVSPGVYFVRIETASGTFSRPLLLK